VRQRRRGQGGGPRRPGGRGGGAPGGGRGRGGQGQQQSNVERPRTDEKATSPEGREQPAVEPETQVVPEAVTDAPDTTTPKQQVEDPTKLEQSGDPSQEKTSGDGSGGRGSKKGRS
jgi:hypothetical protein